MGADTISRRTRAAAALIALVALLLAGVAGPAAAGNKLYAEDVFTAEAVTAGGTATSAAIDLSDKNPVGAFSLQVAVSGDGTAKIEYQLSNDGTTYLEPSGAVDVASGLVKTSGPGSDGNDIFYFQPKLGKYIRFLVTETGGVSSVTVTADLIFQ